MQSELDIKPPEAEGAARLVAGQHQQKRRKNTGDSTVTSLVDSDIRDLNDRVSLAALGTLEMILATCVELLKPELQESLSNIVVAASQLHCTGRAGSTICRCISLCAASSSPACAKLLPLALTTVGSRGVQGSTALCGSACEAVVHPRAIPVLLDITALTKPVSMAIGEPTVIAHSQTSAAPVFPKQVPIAP
jgi:hypothetical protein